MLPHASQPAVSPRRPRPARRSVPVSAGARTWPDTIVQPHDHGETFDALQALLGTAVVRKHQRYRSIESDRRWIRGILERGMPQDVPSPPPSRSARFHRPSGTGSTDGGYFIVSPGTLVTAVSVIVIA